MTFSMRKALAATSALGLAIFLAACGPDETVTETKGHFALGDASGPFDWPMGEYGSGPLESMPADAYGDWAPLGAAQPMVARPVSDHGYAPAWDYPDDYRYEEPQFASYGDDYYDAGYYEDRYYDSPYFERAYYGPAGNDWYDRSPDSSSFALLALAAVLGSVIGDSPPDYYFDYGRVEPWAWVTEDRYVRYAEPLQSGYRYYYYAPDANRPFLVRDPLYTYGYSGERLVVIYDDYGRVLNRDRALRLRRAASSYYDRGVTLYRAGMTSERHGVSAPLWQRRSAVIAADQQAWDRSRRWNPGWQDWNRRYDKAVTNHWKRERIARNYAANRFAAWQDDGFSGEAPKPRRELRLKSNPQKAMLRQAALETRRQDIERSARLERWTEKRRLADNRPVLRREERADNRGQERQVRSIAARRAEARDRNVFGRREQASAQRQQVQRPHREARREQASAQRQQVQRQQREVRREQASAQRQQGQRQQREVRREQAAAQRQQAQRQQREARREQAAAQRQQAQRQQREARREQAAAQRQQAQRQQREARREQAAAQRQQAQRQQREARREQAAAQRQQAQRQQREARREQAAAQRQQAQRQQREARREQASAQRQQAQRQQREARREQAAAQRQQAQRQQREARSQQAAAQRQQVQRQQREARSQQASAQRQQQARQSFASTDRRGQGGQNRGNGRMDR